MTRSAISDVSGQTENLRSITLWVLEIVSALTFAIAGISKLIVVAVMVQVFEITGMGQWFRYLAGTGNHRKDSFGDGRTA